METVFATKIAGVCDSSVPEKIRVVLSLHSVIRVEERLFDTFSLTQNEVLEKLRVIERGDVSRNPASDDNYFLRFSGTSFLFMLKRLEKNVFMATTFMLKPEFLKAMRAKRTEVGINFELDRS